MRDLIQSYFAEARRLASINKWDQPADVLPATEVDVERTENRLGIRFPPSLHQFYLLTNGLPAVGWIVAAIYSLSEIDYVSNLEPSIVSCTHLVLGNEKPWRNDPEGSRKRDYIDEQCTRVTRSLALTSSVDDSIVVLVDPESRSDDGELRCGQWFGGVASWNYLSFRDYFAGSIDFLKRQSV